MVCSGNTSSRATIQDLAPGEARQALKALEQLQLLGIHSVADVEQAVEVALSSSGMSRCSSSSSSSSSCLGSTCSSTASASMVSDLEGYLQGGDSTDVPVEQQVCEWITQKDWFWRALETTPAYQTRVTPAQKDEGEEEEEEEEEKEDYRTMALRLMQAGDIIEQSLRAEVERAGPGVQTSFTWELASGSGASPFAQVVEEVQQAEWSAAHNFVDYPTTVSTDSFRGTTRCRRMLMQTAVRTTSPAQRKEAEFFVNLLAEGPSQDSFTTFLVITSQGTMTNLRAPSIHSAVSNRSTAQRAGAVEEALHLFKVALVSLAEHISEHVVRRDFLANEEGEEEAQCIEELSMNSAVSVPAAAAEFTDAWEECGAATAEQRLPSTEQQLVLTPIHLHDDPPAADPQDTLPSSGGSW